jgi:DNA-binding NtrC family response regulator
VADGRFREDLYHRLRVLELQMPPLRDRDRDIALIAQQALCRHAGDAGRRIRGFSADALQALHRYAWPGNVRELVNRVREAVVMAEGQYINARDLGLEDIDGEAPITLDAARGNGERVAIERALLRNGGRLLATARELGVSRVTLYRLINRHGLRVADDIVATRTG